MTNLLPAQRYVGSSVLRSEDKRILTGAGRYVDDVQLPGMLHATFVRSTSAHARITSVDVDAATFTRPPISVPTVRASATAFSPHAPVTT